MAPPFRRPPAWDDDDEPFPDPADEAEEDLPEDEQDDESPCPHCGCSIFDDAARCPECGAYLPQVGDGAWWRGRSWLWLALGVLGIAALVLTLVLGY